MNFQPQKIIKIITKQVKDRAVYKKNNRTKLHKILNSKNGAYHEQNSQKKSLANYPMSTMPKQRHKCCSKLAI